jgi:hypothetical protein
VSDDHQLLAQVAAITRRCPNCETELQGQFCYHCGQNQKPPDRFLYNIINEAFDDIFGSDSKTGRTLLSLFFRPGFLTIEYFAGKRARYIHPFRLYIITSLVFFFFLSLISTIYPKTEIVINDTEKKETTEWVKDIDESLIEFNIGWLSQEQNDYARTAIGSQATKAINRYKDNPGDLAGEFIELVPQVMFFLLPLFAMMMTFFYLGSGKYYSEHLVLAVHNHCFLFLALLFTQVLDLYATSSIAVVVELLNAAVSLWIPFYMYLSLRTAYGEGYFLSFIKFSLCSLSYFGLFVLGVLFAFFWGVMTL